MTREEIMAMPAGPEIDELVAEQVMGWSRRTGAVFTNESAWHPPGSTHWEWVPKYSTDIAAAWKVIGSAQPGWRWTLTNDRVDSWTCTITGSAWAQTSVDELSGVPLAICLAALLKTLKNPWAVSSAVMTKLHDMAEADENAACFEVTGSEWVRTSVDELSSVPLAICLTALLTNGDRAMTDSELRAIRETYFVRHDWQSMAEVLGDITALLAEAGRLRSVLLAFKELLAYAEEAAEFIDGETGQCRSLEQLEKANNLPREIVNARAALAAISMPPAAAQSQTRSPGESTAAP